MRHFKLQKLGAVPVGVLAGALLICSFASGATKSPALSGSARLLSDTPSVTALRSPAIPGVAPLPGPIAGPATPSPNMGILDVTPDEAVAGTPITISGSHLPASSSIELTWSTADATWM